MTRATRLKAAPLAHTSMVLVPEFLTAATAMLFSISAAVAGSMEPPAGAAACSGCHPANSVAETSVPALAGRDAQEIMSQMHAFQSGQRNATVMDRIANGYSAAEIEAIANWYQAQR